MLSPTQIRDDLRAAFRGRLHFDPPTRGLYATDASPFEIVPHGVAVPVDEDDLRALVKYAHETQLPLVARGAGTGLAGEALGFGLVVDLSVHFRRVVQIDDEAVTVQPGVTHAALDAALARHGRRFAPRPASSRTCTVGGMIATNASGGAVFRHGYTRDHVQALRVVWDDGTADTVPSATPAERTIDIRSQTAALVAENRDLIQVTRPHTRFNRCGYVLHDVLTPNGLDLVKLLVGSEGTLGFVTEATLRTVPVAGGTCHALLGFATIEEAVRAGLGLHSAEGLVGCDLLDQRLLAVSRIANPECGVGLIPPTVGAALILSVEAETQRDALAQGLAAVERVRDAHRVGVLAQPTCDPNGLARITRFRESAVGGVYTRATGPRPLPCVEDVAVPPEELGRYLAGVRDLLKRHDLTASTHAHVLSGQVHTRPFVDPSKPDDLAKLWPLAEAVHGLALTLGGTVSTQHGTGLARTPWVEKQYGGLMPIFRELKRIFDPIGILNPGKIVGPDPSRPAWPFAQGVSNGAQVSREAQPSEPIALPVAELSWEKVDPAAVAMSCNGCGDCRTRDTSERMCPVFRATGDEAATPRAKANLFKQLLAQPDVAKDAEEVWAVADLCVNCKMCRDECRARVDIPKLVLETKARLYAEHGLARGDWLPARTDGLAAFAGYFAFTANSLLGMRSARWLLEKMFGLSRRLLVPKLASQSFLRRARRAGWSQPPTGESSGPQNVVVPGPGLSHFELDTAAGNKLAYFVDTFANRFDPSIGEAAVAVLRHHGFEVCVPWRQRASGMNPLAYGDAELARETAAANVRTLAELVRDGYHVICTEPTAAVALTQDYLDLLDDADTRLVAANTSELTAYLWRLHEAGRLRTDFRPLDVTLGHHVPCHVRALPGHPAGPRLLELIPGVRVRTIDVGCSGMAGTWGLRVRTREASLAAGADMLAEFDRPGVLFGSTECGACRVQMQDAARKRTLHPVQYLALAYGLMPELADRLTKPLGTLVTD